MTPFRPTSHDRPGEQISTTPSGLKVTSAKRLMVDSMVRMIQKAELKTQLVKYTFKISVQKIKKLLKFLKITN